MSLEPLERELVLLRYIDALESGDLDGIAACLQLAEQDKELEAMILELHTDPSIAGFLPPVSGTIGTNHNPVRKIITMPVSPRTSNLTFWVAAAVLTLVLAFIIPYMSQSDNNLAVLSLATEQQPDHEVDCLADRAYRVVYAEELPDLTTEDLKCAFIVGDMRGLDISHLDLSDVVLCDVVNTSGMVSECARPKDDEQSRLTPIEQANLELVTEVIDTAFNKGTGGIRRLDPYYLGPNPVVDQVMTWHRPNNGIRGQIILPTLLSGTNPPINYEGITMTSPLRNLHIAFPDLQVTILNTFIENNLVVAHLRFDGTFEKPLASFSYPTGGEQVMIEPTGKLEHWEGIFKYRIVNGVIIEEWWFWDNLLLQDFN